MNSIVVWFYKRSRKSRKEKGLYCGHLRAAKETKYPLEESGKIPRALFGVDRGGVKGAVEWSVDS